MKQKIYLIGGSGFIGKNLSAYFYAQYDISIFDKFIDAPYFAQYPAIKTYEVDLVENLIVGDLPTPDYIINLASIVTAERDMSLFDALITSNLKVLLNLYKRFGNDRRLKLFVQFGSSEEYGSENSPFLETQREVPTSPYALVKQLTGNTAIMLYRDFDFPAMAVRPGNIFGPMQPESKFIPYVISQLKANAPINVTPCEQKRDTLHIEDFAWAIGELLRNADKCKGEIVNVSSGESIALRDIIDFSKEYLRSTSPVNYGALPYRENEVMDLRCSVAKLSAIIGKDVKFDIYTRLKQYIDYQKTEV
ncbi:CDP-abequose synthase [Candidatus Symbiothrix dinenymphae]|nr:CDP-abequose synthase [Candidatus Symbiothrix dinenymphae]